MIENPSQSSGFVTLHTEDSHDSGSNSAGERTAGMVLREARVSAGLHIAALAVALKVPVKKLEALESDRHDLLLDMVFVRALASSVCRNLKIDPASVLELLPHQGRSAFGPGPVSAPASFNAYPTATKTTGRAFASISRPAAFAGLLLVIGAAALVLWPSIRQTVTSFTPAGQTKDAFSLVLDKLGMSASGAPLAADDNTDVPVPGVIEVSGPKGVASAPGSITASAEATGLTASPRLTANRADPATLEPALSPPPSAGSASVALKSTPDIAPSGSLVTFSATAQPSWVKVTDAKGAVVLSRTISPGEQVSASGALPLAVVVGRADVTSVLVRGVALDLGAYSKENVARFEVK